MLETREYRAAMPFEAIDDSGYIVEGYATTFDSPYDFGRSGMKEQILRSALDGADMSDIIFQMNHEGMVLARQRNGSLTVTCDDHGLKVRANLGGSEVGRRLYEAIKNGLMDRMSWGFTVAEGGWDYDEMTRTASVVRVDKVYDVSAVSVPANDQTVISARSYINGVIEREQQELLMREKRERETLALKLRLLSY